METGFPNQPIIKWNKPKPIFEVTNTKLNKLQFGTY